MWGSNNLQSSLVYTLFLIYLPNEWILWCVRRWKRNNRMPVQPGIPVMIINDMGVRISLYALFFYSISLRIAKYFIYLPGEWIWWCGRGWERNNSNTRTTRYSSNDSKRYGSKHMPICPALVFYFISLRISKDLKNLPNEWIFWNLFLFWDW